MYIITANPNHWDFQNQVELIKEILGSEAKRFEKNLELKEFTYINLFYQIQIIGIRMVEIHSCTLQTYSS